MLLKPTKSARYRASQTEDVSLAAILGLSNVPELFVAAAEPDEAGAGAARRPRCSAQRGAWQLIFTSLLQATDKDPIPSGRACPIWI
ncbi:MAG: hypothetical protein QOF94_1841 [Acidobacteriaceae bacterium]|jgi:hypothetical protein